MGKEFDETNRGVLFKNANKESDRHPDYKGHLNVAGKEFWLDAWIKEGAKGKFMSVSVKPKEPRQNQRQSTRQSAPQSSGFDDDQDVPF